MMKVINLISILMGSMILQNSLLTSSLAFNASILVIVVSVLLTVAIAIALWYSKRETEIFAEKDKTETEKKRSSRKTK